MRWVGHVASVGAMKGARRVLVWKPEGKDYLEVLDIDGRIILKWTF
jgi:hypothetical protein